MINRDYEFKAVFLTDEGQALVDSGGETNNEERYKTVLPVTLDLDSLEAYWFIKQTWKGQPMCRARTKTGDEWNLVISYNQLRAIKNGGLKFRQN